MRSCIRASLQTTRKNSKAKENRLSKRDFGEAILSIREISEEHFVCRQPEKLYQVGKKELLAAKFIYKHSSLGMAGGVSGTVGVYRYLRLA